MKRVMVSLMTVLGILFAGGTAYAASTDGLDTASIDYTLGTGTSPSSQTAFGGGLTGDVTATIEGQTDPVTGTVDAQWSINQTLSGGTAILASGLIAAKGFSAKFNWSRDAQGNASGSWTVPGLSGFGGDFTFDVSTMAYAFSGTIPGGPGTDSLQISGSGAFTPQGTPLAQVGGPLSGDISGTIDASAMGTAVTGDFSGLTGGKWYVSVYSATDLSGIINGPFSGSAVTDPIPLGGFASLPGMTAPITGRIDGTFNSAPDGSLSFAGQINYTIDVQGTTVSAATGFDFNIPFDMSQGIKLQGTLPFSGTTTVSVPIIGSLAIDYTVTAVFDISLTQGDPSALVPVQVPQDASNAWYITGTIPGQDTCGVSAGITPTTLSYNNAPINVTAHGATLTGSDINPADTSTVYGSALIPEPGTFSIAVDGAADSVTVFIFSDTDNSGNGSSGDIGGHYCDAATGLPAVVNSPGPGNTIDISGFILGAYTGDTVNLAGNVIIDGSTLSGTGTDAKIITQVYDAAGGLLDFGYSSINALGFCVRVDGVSAGDTVTINVFADTNGNGSEDAGEPAGSVSHTVGSNAGDNDNILVTLN